MILANYSEINENKLVIATIKGSYRRPKRSYGRLVCRIKEFLLQIARVIGIATHSFGMLAMTNQEFFSQSPLSLSPRYPVSSWDSKLNPGLINQGGYL